MLFMKLARAAAGGAALILLSACGSEVETQSASGSAAAGGTTTSTGTGEPIPPACQVLTSQAPPYAVTFRFTNPTSSPLYLRQGCELEYAIAPCADGFASSLARSGTCTVDCADPDVGCIACGACQQAGVAVPAQGTYEAQWSGLHYTFGQNASGCSCHTEHVAPASLYRLTAAIYDTEEAAATSAAIHGTVTVEFELPAPGGVVEVPVG